MKMTKEEAFNMLKNRKVYAGEFTKQVQERLFEIGFRWYSSGKQIMGYEFIITFSDGLQACSSYKSFIEYFNNLEEITISQILGIELEPEFKDGDILHSDWGGEDITFIFKKTQTKSQDSFYYYASISNTLGILFDESFWTKDINIRYATKEECDTLLDAIYNQGYKWNAKEKKLEKKRWRAKYGEYYYYFDTILNIEKEKDLLLMIDDERYDIYNYFKTEQEAQQYADKIKEFLQNREA